MDDEMLSSREIAGKLGISNQTVRRWASAGHFPCQWIGGPIGYRMRLADVLAYLATRHPPTRGRPRKRTGAGDDTGAVDSPA